MSWMKLFQRLILRPLWRDPARTALTAFAVSLGVAVVVAIDLAGAASADEFRSSMETLSGEADLEITSTGGLDESVLADLARLPYPLEYSPRVEGFATVKRTGEAVPVFGLDLLGDETLSRTAEDGEFVFDDIGADDAAWVGWGLAEAPGETLELRINDRTSAFAVKGVLQGAGFQAASAENIVILDIAAAQRVLGEAGRLTRIQVHTPEGDAEDWEALLARALPDGAQIYPVGSKTEENRKMLGAFRWNLRVLSWISLIVGAFLIYNTIAVSVVRRRVEIGVLRALGATRSQVRGAFLAEAAFFGAVGTVLGLLIGRWMATGALEMMALTVRTLYVSGEAGAIAITPLRLATAAAAGVGVALLAAWQPSNEAARVAPTEAMARGRHEHQARLRVGRDLAWGLVLMLAAAGASLAPPVGGAPLFGYLAAVLLLGGSALTVPAVVRALSAFGARWAQRLVGIEGFLGSRGVAASLSRTSILVGALSTAVAMMVSVAVMVGSFRDTVSLWMERQLQADVFIRPAGDPARDRFPTMDAAVADLVEALPGVEAVDRFRGYRIRYNGRPATLGAGDAAVHGARSGIRFLEGGPAPAILARMTESDYAIVSEPFARKHDVWTGARIALPLGGRSVEFEVAGVFYDYSSENGAIIVDRRRLERYLPSTNASSLAVYLEPGQDAASMRDAIAAKTQGRELYIVTNRTLRGEAIKIFDRTFAITYALEAVAIVVAILGMAGALLALVIDRKREISVLRFLGASAGQIRKLILTESGLLGLLSLGIGTVLGTALSLVLIYVINKQSFGWTIQFDWPVRLLSAALGLIYCASLLAGLYPARIAARLNPIEAMHEE